MFNWTVDRQFYTDEAWCHQRQVDVKRTKIEKDYSLTFYNLQTEEEERRRKDGELLTRQVVHEREKGRKADRPK